MGALLEKLLGNPRKVRGGSTAARVFLTLLAMLTVFLCIRNREGILSGIGEMGMYLNYRFVQRALVVGVLVSLCAALLGVTLVLKRYSMIGDGLSHVGFGALAIAISLGTVTAEKLPEFLPQGVRVSLAEFCTVISENPLPFTLVIVIALAFMILRLNGAGKIQGDAAIAILSTSALATGVLVTSMTSGMNLDLMNYMFGSILAMSETDVVLSVTLSAVVLILFLLFCNRIFSVTFDENFARATGTRSGMFNMLIAILTAVTIVIGMRMMGTMLISSLIIFPALTSMRVFSHFRAVLISSAVISVVCFVLGIMFSCLFALPAGAAVVLFNLVAFLLFGLIGKARE